MANHTAVNSLLEIPSERSDVVLVVEGKKLHVNKEILSHASPVFARMFEGDFKERNEDEIPLPNKSYEDIHQMLRCIYPSVLEDVTMENVDVLVKLSDEYQILALKMKCERVLSSAIQRSNDFKLIVHGMYLGEHFDLDKLLECSVNRASQVQYMGKYGTQFSIRHQSEYSLLSLETKVRYLAERVCYLESKM